jgi:membrane-associated phospholipid phosphatase
VIVRYLDERQGGMTRLLRLLYPALLFTFFYRATGGTMFLLFDYFLDPQFTAFEHSIFGVNPTLYIDRHLLHPIISEIVLLAYFSYYFMILAWVLAVYLRGDYGVIKSSITAFCGIFFISYMMFWLFPLEGPRWYFADRYFHDVASPVARHLTEYIMHSAAVRGGCMPSSHFAIAVSIQMYAFRFYRRAGWFLLPVVLAMGIGTFWGRYHYVSDTIVGGLLGAIITLIVWRHYSPKKMRRPDRTDVETPVGNHVS